MARTKNTGRKERDQPPLQRATKSYVCHKCTKAFTGSNNLNRHLGIIHGVTRDDHPISAEKLAIYRSYNAKRGRSGRKTTSTATTSAAVSTAATSPRPTTTTAAARRHESPNSSEESTARYATPGLTATPPRPEESSGTTEFAATTSAATRTTPVRAATPRPTTVRRVKVKGTSRRNASKGKMPAPAKSSDDAPVRKPTRPQLPSPRSARTTTMSIMPVPRVKTLPSKRKVRLSPTNLAKKVARAGKRTSQSLADDLANEFSLPSTERRTNQNVIIGMRAARRHLCSKIRRALPLNRTKQDIRTFLDAMEQLCHTTEMGPSDEEFV